MENLSPSCRLADIKAGSLSESFLREIPLSPGEIERYQVKLGDILTIRVNGSPDLVGRFIPCTVERKWAYCDHLIRMRIPHGFLDQRYLCIYADTAAARAHIANKTLTTAGQKTVNQTGLGLIPMLVPPLAEQHRIVAKVDQLMALCDELEARQQKRNERRTRLSTASIDKLLTARESDEFAEHWQRICDHFDLLSDTPESIGQFRQAILQLAVQGKLVPQDPNDEPAEVLLEKIREEQVKLFDEGKLKRFKKLPPIREDQVPFNLPSGWTWGRFPELGEFGRGKSKHRPRNDRKLYIDGRYPLVQTGDVARASGTIRTYTGLYNEVGLAQSKLWPQGTLCITIAANIADSALLGFEACTPDSVVGLIPSSQIGDARYFEYFIRTAKERLQDFAPSTAQKNINLAILETVLIPLPPLREMNRIVAKVDQLMSLCDKLEIKLKQSQIDSGNLMDTMVLNVLAA